MQVAPNIDQTIFLRSQLLLFTLRKHTTFIKYICLIRLKLNEREFNIDRENTW